uniref:Uncharacterized protein n=1 Tax=Anguilla anguilla TaxID=7936 RepID=A0A0E9XG72_ANGAN
MCCRGPYGTHTQTCMNTSLLRTSPFFKLFINNASHKPSFDIFFSFAPSWPHPFVPPHPICN